MPVLQWNDLASCTAVDVGTIFSDCDHLMSPVVRGLRISTVPQSLRPGRRFGPVQLSSVLVVGVMFRAAMLDGGQSCNSVNVQLSQS